MFLDAVVYKGKRFKEKSILDVTTHFKKTETFQYTHFTSCHPPSLKKGFVKGEALRMRRTNSSKTTFKENISNFKKRLIDRGYPQTMIENLLLDTKFTERESALLKHNNKEEKEILPFVTQYQPSASTLKELLMNLEILNLESYTKPTVTSPNFQRTTYHFLQERKFPKGHAR